MKFRLLSDIHLEFGAFTIPRLETDKKTILLLAGDIGVCSKKGSVQDFLMHHKNQFHKIIYIPGNHEYYRGIFPTSWENIREDIYETQSIKNKLCLINNKTIIEEDVAIIGATLWTQNPNEKTSVEAFMNDYSLIKTKKNGVLYRKTLSTADTIREYEISKRFIFDECIRCKKKGKKVIIMTHHAPSYKSISLQFKSSSLNPAYASSLDGDILELGIKGFAPDVWVHGHTHSSSDYNIGNTRIICNPRGYKGSDENPYFRDYLSFIV